MVVVWERSLLQMALNPIWVFWEETHWSIQVLKQAGILAGRGLILDQGKKNYFFETL